MQYLKYKFCGLPALVISIQLFSQTGTADQHEGKSPLSKSSLADPYQILQLAREKCNSIQNGYYELTNRMKYMSENDTNTRSVQLYFKKLSDDRVHGMAFSFDRYSKEEYQGSMLYSGNELVYYSKLSKQGTSKENKKWANEMIRLKHNYDFAFFPPILEEGFIPDDSEIRDSAHLTEYLGQETINGVICHHVKFRSIPVNEPDDPFQELRREFHYWIDAAEFTPIQLDIYVDMLNLEVIMYQYERFTLDKFEFNNLKDSIIFSKSSIPSDITLTDYVPVKRPELLEVKKYAPDWYLLSLSGDSVKLSDLKGKVVLIDFFYKSCPPCIQAMPALQMLHEKYESHGLLVIGVDPYDDESDNIEEFLAERGATYKVCLGGRPVSDTYHVSAYPTIYIINKEGKIVHAHAGYGPGIELVLEKLIVKHLKMRK